MYLVHQNECLNNKVSPKNISPSLQRLPRLPSANSHERLPESSTGSWRPQKSPNCRTLWSLESANWIIQGELVASFPGNRHIIYFTRACNASADDVFPQKVRRTYKQSPTPTKMHLVKSLFNPFSTSVPEGVQSIPPLTLKAVSNKLGAGEWRNCAKKLICLISSDWTKICIDQEETLLVSDSVSVRMDEPFESIAHSIHLVVNY